MEGSDLYKKNTYRNKDIIFLISREIIEYDISQAGYSLVKEYGLLSEDKIKKLEPLSKDARHRRIGLYQKKDSVFNEKLKDAFIDIRKRFFEANELHDDDVLSIKKDAIFTLRYSNNTDFGHVHFAEKNHYTSYVFINNLEFLYSPIKLDVKGVSDDILPLHEEYMLNFMMVCFRNLEVNGQETQLRYLRKFVDKYKARDLPVGYYRRLDINSKFISRDDPDLEFNSFWEDQKESLDIDYNYKNYVIPMVKLSL
jgi:hypothetical protein